MALSIQSSRTLKKDRKTLKTKRCKYTFVVKEMPLGSASCPNSVNEVPQKDIFSKYSKPMTSMTSMVKDGEIQNLAMRLQHIEQNLNGEIQKNDFLNATISKQERDLQKADHQLQECRGNFSKIFKLVNHLERTIQAQKTHYRDLEKKVSSVVLDVVEVNNVLAKKTAPLSGIPNVDKKEILVESVANIRSCGLTNPDAIFRGKIACSLIEGEFETVVYFICGRRRVSVPRYRMICLILVLLQVFFLNFVIIY